LELNHPQPWSEYQLSTTTGSDCFQNNCAEQLQEQLGTD
jgi:hypothetical protein